jgi:hypothetical protein
MRKGPVFIVGLHRTGSTLLKNMMDINSDMCMIPEELHLWSPYPWRVDLTDICKEKNMSRNEAKRILDELFSGKLYGAFWRNIGEYGIEKDEIEKNIKDGMRCIDIVNLIFENYVKKKGKSGWGAKYPVHIGGINRLKRWYPDARLIHLTRDPRAIYVSKSNDEASRRRKEKHPFLHIFINLYTMLQISFEYRISASFHRKYNGKQGYTLLRYEELLENPEKKMKRICEFSGIEFEEDMLNALGKPSSITGEVKRGIDRNRKDAWEKVISPWERILIDMMTARSRKILGYKR